MKKTLLLTVALILTGLNSAMAAIDDELRTIITKSDGIELTEVTNDANNPWTIADGVATSTVGKMSSAHIADLHHQVSRYRAHHILLRLHRRLLPLCRV